MSYGLAPSPAPSLPLDALFRRLESYLPCRVCSAPGPHRTYSARACGSFGLCGDCRRLVEAEAAQDRREYLADRLQVAHA